MKNIFSGISILIIFFGTVIYFVAPTLTTYKDKNNFSAGYSKYCGFLLKCQYYNFYKPEILEIVINQPIDSSDKDYYFNYKGLKCKGNFDIISVVATFKSTNDTISFEEKTQGKSIILNSTINQDKIDRYNNIELQIFFATGQKQTIILEKNVGKDFNNKDVGIILITGILICLTYILWTIIYYFLTKQFNKLSFTKRNLIAGIISLTFIISIFKIVTSILL